MMQTTQSTIVPFPARHPPSVQEVIEAYGAWRVLSQALRALLRPAPQRRLAAQVAHLDDRLRRDIGLPPKPEAPARWALMAARPPC